MNSLDGEIWKDVPDYEGYYHVSNKGRVKGFFLLGKPNVRILHQHSKGVKYVGFTLCKPNAKPKGFGTHRLVALAFIPNPENKFTVNHIDFNPKNNNLENLEWLTLRENFDYSLNYDFINSKPAQRFLKEFGNHKIIRNYNYI